MSIVRAICWMLLPIVARGDIAAPIDPTVAIRVSQAAIGRTVSDHTFTDSHGRTFTLDELRGQPLIVSLVFTQCAFICPSISTRLKQVDEIALETVGAQYRVLTIGFDTARDTPERMRDYALARRIDAPHWRFASADAATIADLTRELGFTFAPAAGGFDHLAQITILDGKGRVYAQAYGPEFDPPALIDPLKRLVLGASIQERPLAELLRKARLLCTTYDPKTGRYRFDYSLIWEIAIGLTLALGIGAVLIKAWRQR